MKSNYADWLYYRLIAERREADPEALRRSILLVSGMVSRLDESPSAQALLRARLASLPFVQRLVADNPTLLSALNLPLEATRGISAEDFAKTQDYVDAVVRALRGDPEATLTDIGGKTHAVRLISYLRGRPPYPTVAFVPENGPIFVAADFRLQYLTLEGQELRHRLTAYRADWEFTGPELDDLAAALERAEPAERLRLMDRMIQKSAAVHLHWVEQCVHKGEIGIDDLRPPEADQVVRFLGGSEHEKRTETLLERLPLYEVLARAFTIPLAIPRFAMERFCALSRREKRELFRMLSVRSAAPVPTVHQLRLLLHEAPNDAVRERLLLQACGRIMRGMHLGPMLEYCSWAFTEFSRRPNAGDTNLPDRLISAWALASEIGAAANVRGVELADLLTVVPSNRQWERYVCDIVEDSAPSSPLRLSILEVCVRFADYIIREHPKLAKGFLSVVDSSVLRTDSPWPLHIDLYTSLSPVEDPLHSLFEEPIRDVLERFLGDRFTPNVRESLSSAYAIRVIREKVEEEPLWWHFLRRRTRGGVVDKELIAALTVRLSIGADPELALNHPAEWRARLVTLAQALGTFDPVRTATLLTDSLRVAEGGPEPGQAGMALLLAAAAAHRHLRERMERVEKMVELLEQFAESNDSHIREIAWQLARAMRDRLPARDVDSRISRIILVGRRSV